ncbi:MAG: hypothetical protein ABFS21_11900 [Actinomycetota bacterium]
MTLLTVAVAAPALAGSPHFVGKTAIEWDGNSLTVSGKIAGLGNEDQVEVQTTVDAQCVNPGGNKPQADNKESFAAAGTFPVQNGKALFELTATASFQPDCSPPMTVVFSDLVVTDLTHGISRTFPGPF